MGPIEDQSQETINAYFKQAVTNKLIWPRSSFMFDKDVSNDNISVKYMRSVLAMGAPLNVNGIQYNSRNDRKDE